MDEINIIERILIEDDLAGRGVTHYQMKRGAAGWVWVWYGLVNAYYRIHQGKIVEIQYD